ncbi:Alpha/Beta hydrolase protein [Podospora didyma]|uniref:Alpha/Beta hydrolase protein n=1 Tax=Podospora didyma TaxID=330526 RepID=A0AAE0K2I5_9PEZI|nr:Alpha/Beta hydrolase protein [Podospora didyma]
MAQTPLDDPSQRPAMHYEQCTANDGCPLAFQTSLPLTQGTLAAGPKYNTCILLMHGFSGSSEYFTRNFDALSKHYWVVAPDMRGHGRSGRTKGGYHVARLASDLNDLVTHLVFERPRVSPPAADDKPLTVVPVGCSIGAAVLWTYVEIFGSAAFQFSGFVFVDQAPVQDRSRFDGWDASKAHRGCYDEATLLAAQEAWISRPAETHLSLVAECLGYRHAPDNEDNVSSEQRARDEAFFTAISAQCDGTWLARLLADHTRYDHREALEEIAVPTLVMAGWRSGCFPFAGMREIIDRIKHSGKVDETRVTVSVYGSGHWLFYEQPEQFNRDVLEFVGRCAS